MSTAYRHNGREITPAPSVDFDWSQLEKLETEQRAENRERLPGIEFALAHAAVSLIRRSDNPALAADLLFWSFSWTKESARALARKHGMSHVAFIKAARVLEEGLPGATEFPLSA